MDMLSNNSKHKYRHLLLELVLKWENLGWRKTWRGLKGIRMCLCKNLLDLDSSSRQPIISCKQWYSACREWNNASSKRCHFWQKPFKVLEFWLNLYSSNMKAAGAYLKLRRKEQDGVSENENSTPPDGQIVKYQPFGNDSAQEVLQQLRKLDANSKSNSNNLYISNSNQADMDLYLRVFRYFISNFNKALFWFVLF